MKIYFETYGCTSNKADTRIMERLAEEAGYEITDKIEESDLVVLNTCVVISKTENRMISRIEELKDKDLVVAGCLTEINKEEVLEIKEDIDFVSPTNITKFLEVIGGGKKSLSKEEAPSRKDGVIGQVQISEGCVGNCSYCVTKFARGELRIFSIDEVVRKARSLINEGVRELQLTAQDTATYGLKGKNDLYDLLNQINEIKGDFRVRVGMMNPQNVLGRIERVMKIYELNKVYNFLHLPVQSGSNKILGDMKRGYQIKDFKKIVNAFKERFDGVLSTDIIVGYPSETSEDYEKTISLIKEIKPHILNITRFSPRSGTEAYGLEEIDSKVKKNRSKELTELKKEIGKEVREKEIDSVKNVLITKEGKEGTMIGKDKDYNTVVVEGGHSIGDFLDVKIKECSFAYLVGEKLNC